METSRAPAAYQTFIEISQLKAVIVLKEDIPMKVKKVCKLLLSPCCIQESVMTLNCSLIKSSCKIICHKYVNMFFKTANDSNICVI